MTDIAPCPFCGGPGELAGHKAPEFWVRCPAIGCKASTEAFGDQERAVAAWNRRYTFRSAPEVLANRMGGTFEPAKYSADWIRQQTAGLSWLPHHDCGGCGTWVGYVIRGEQVFFRSACDCSYYSASAPDRPSSFEEIAKHLQMQDSDEIRDRIMRRALGQRP